MYGWKSQAEESYPREHEVSEVVYQEHMPRNKRQNMELSIIRLHGYLFLLIHPSYNKQLFSFQKVL